MSVNKEIANNKILTFVIKSLILLMEMFGYPFTSFPAAPVNLTLSSQHSYISGVWWQGISTSFYRNEWEKIKQTQSGGIAPLKM